MWLRICGEKSQCKSQFTFVQKCINTVKIALDGIKTGQIDNLYIFEIRKIGKNRMETKIVLEKFVLISKISIIIMQYKNHKKKTKGDKEIILC